MRTTSAGEAGRRRRSRSRRRRRRRRGKVDAGARAPKTGPNPIVMDWSTSTLSGLKWFFTNFQ